MSRIGRAPIDIPNGVSITVEGAQVTVKGPKGQLDFPISPRLEVGVEDGVLTVQRPSDHRNDRAQHGLARSLINNAVLGVTEGFTKSLEIRGVGYRAQMKGSTIELSVGYSHPVLIEAPQGIVIETPEPTRITVTGIDKQLVGQVAANIRDSPPVHLTRPLQGYGKTRY